jgi:hypothetical protein
LAVAGRSNKSGHDRYRPVAAKLEQVCKVSSRRAIRFAKDHVRVRELVVRNYELSRVNKPGGMNPRKMCRHD